MKIYSGLTSLQGQSGTSVALGFFDGVHLGHQAVINAAVSCGKEKGLEPAVFTFSLPLTNGLKGGRICTEEEKHRLMESLGVAHYLEPAFADFCGLSPEDFVHQVLHQMCRAKAVFCGDNFTFGKKAAGNVQLLKKLCEPLGIQVHQVPMAVYEGRTVSSTRIRLALEAGDIPAANAMLGRPYRVSFPVKHGKGLGRTLGFPTINQVYPEGFILPKFGIYITRVEVQPGLWLPGATGFGTRPTVNHSGEGPTCETFIPGYEGQLYDACPSLEFYQYIAPSKKYDSLEELTAVVLKAAKQAQEYFAESR